MTRERQWASCLAWGVMARLGMALGGSLVLWLAVAWVVR